MCPVTLEFEALKNALFLVPLSLLIRLCPDNSSRPLYPTYSWFYISDFSVRFLILIGFADVRAVMLLPLPLA